MHLNINSFSENIIKIANETNFYGESGQYNCFASVVGICGDKMDFFLFVKDNIIEDVKFYTTGCISSKACGNTAAKFIFGKNIYDALKLSPKIILDELKDLPCEYHHCSILSCITIYKALGEYFVK